MPAATPIRTAMRTRTAIITTEANLRLLAWLSPAFPTGGFAWSHGVEWAVECGDIADRASLLAWLDGVMRFGSGRSDAILLRHAHRAAQQGQSLEAIIEVALALASSRERLAESVGQGNAFRLAAGAWDASVLQGAAGDLPYAVAVGAMAGANGVAEDLACAAYLQAVAANLISAAVRLVPLGQTAGLSVLAALEPVIAGVAASAAGVGLDQVGGCGFRSDIAAMRHETQYTRLFRS